MPKRQIITPIIKKSPLLGKLRSDDVAVTIGGSKPDVVITPQGSQTDSTRKPIGNHKATGRKPKRSQRVLFVPDEVTSVILKQWKDKYGARHYTNLINRAIENYQNPKN